MIEKTTSRLPSCVNTFCVAGTPKLKIRFFIKSRSSPTSNSSENLGLGRHRRSAAGPRAESRASYTADLRAPPNSTRHLTANHTVKNNTKKRVDSAPSSEYSPLWTLVLYFDILFPAF